MSWFFLSLEAYKVLGKFHSHSSSLVRVQIIGAAIPGYDFIQYLVCTGPGTEAGDSKNLHPFDEVVCDNQDETGSSPSLRQGS